MPKVEAVGFLLSILGFSLKWTLHLAGDMMLMVGLETLAIVYFLQAFRPAQLVDEVDADFYQQFPGSQPAPPENRSLFAEDVAPKAAGMGSAVFLIGGLFKLLFWRGSPALLLTGCGTLIISLLAMAYVGRTNRRYVLVFAFGVGMMSVSFDTLIRQFYRDDPALVARLIYREHYPTDKATEIETQHLLFDWRKRHR